MTETIKTLVTAIAAFAAINLDNIFILMTLFSHKASTLRKSHIVIGQYLGFAVLMVLSLIGAFGADYFPHKWIGVLGIIPIYMGVKSLIDNWRRTGADSDENNEKKVNGGIGLSGQLFRYLLNINVFKVAMIAIANGDDDIGVYISLFSNSSVYQIIVSILTFIILVGAMCTLSYKLIKQPLISKVIQRYGHILNPFILIALGIYIAAGSLV